MKKHKPKMPIKIPNQEFYNQQSGWRANDTTAQRKEEDKEHHNQKMLSLKPNLKPKK